MLKCLAYVIILHTAEKKQKIVGGASTLEKAILWKQVFYPSLLFVIDDNNNILGEMTDQDYIEIKKVEAMKVES
jgi:hypothetical protein